MLGRVRSMSGLGSVILDIWTTTIALKPVSCALAVFIPHHMLNAHAEPLKFFVSPAGLRLHTLSSGKFAHHAELRKQHRLVKSLLMW